MKINAAVMSLWMTCSLFVAWPAAAPGQEFTEEFGLEECHFKTRGSNPFFILQPGYRLRLEGEDDGEQVVVEITVLNQTKVVDGVHTRVVLEKEWIDGEIVEISRNWFAFCKETGTMVYFGEAVDNYEDGEIVNHNGSWKAGAAGAKPGVIMPGLPLVGARYFQEVAPGVALDRAEHVTLEASQATPAGDFQNVLVIHETTPLEPGSASVKKYARGVGLIEDAGLLLTWYGYVNANQAGNGGADDDDNDDDDDDDD